MFLFEYDRRNAESLCQMVESSDELYIEQVYEDVPFDFYARILTLNNGAT